MSFKALASFPIWPCLVGWLHAHFEFPTILIHFHSFFCKYTVKVYCIHKLCTLLYLIFLSEEVPLRRAAFGICDGPDIAACAERLFPSPLDNYHLYLVLPLFQLGMYLSGNKGMQSGITLYTGS